jgi:hypothetical protein
VLVPEARELGAAPTAALEAFARTGGEVVVFSESPLDPALVRREDGRALEDFWREYRDEDRDRIATALAGSGAPRIRTPSPSVRAIRYAFGEGQVLHLLNHDYAPETDFVAPARDVELRVPWSGGATRCTQIGLDGPRELASRIEGADLVIDVPELELYALLVIGGDAR